MRGTSVSSLATRVGDGGLKTDGRGESSASETNLPQVSRIAVGPEVIRRAAAGETDT